MKESDATNRRGAPAMRRQALSLSATSLVCTYCFEGMPLPGVVEARLDAVNLSEWAWCNRAFIESNLLQYGGVLFRGFRIRSRQDFEAFLPSVSSELLHYVEGATPRMHLGGRVYSSTHFPASQRIMPHNELSYVTKWPTRIWFCCLTPSETGGETPLADVRHVFQRIEPSVRQKFAEKGWMLVRNFGGGMSLSWQTAFQTNDKVAAEAYFRSADIEWEWRGENHLRTRQIRPAVARHPVTGEWLWFNHIAFWHISSLSTAVRESMLSVFTEEYVPYSIYYGDGSRIEDSVIEAITEAYARETFAFPWQKGDVLMLDNMLVAHGRNPYTGPREVIVAMGDSCSDRSVSST